MMKTRSKIANQDGVAAVEFAIILPFLVILIFGMIEFSLVLYNKAMITNASRVGARDKIAGFSDSDIGNLVTAYCNTHLINLGGANNTVSAGDVDVAPVILTNGAKAGVSVTVTYDYNFLFASLIGLNQTSISLSGQTIMRNE
jgi:Flp pilus assembly protein TadG